jgi:uncharacterized protein YecE (DUF72 family)
MDFGKLPYAALDNTDFSLPPEPENNRRLLPGIRAASPKVYVGCPRWGVKEWVGKLYPKGTKDSHFLDEYVRQFNCIELNSTFYNLYHETAIARWADRAGERDFRFLPKVYQAISHEGDLTEKTALLQGFQKSIAAFGEHSGPAFLQLSDGFGPQRKKELQYLINMLPTAFDLFVEVRHAGWFAPAEMEWLIELLQPVNKGLIMTDTAGRREACHMHLTKSKTMVRFVANNLHPTDYSRMEAWVQRISYWLEQGLEELYFIIHMESEKHSPELAGYFIDKLNAACGLQLKKPVLLQQNLF